MARNAAFIHFLAGIPKDTLERPRTVLHLKLSLHQARVESVSFTAPGFEATVITRPSVTTSSLENPKRLEAWNTSFIILFLLAAVSGISLSATGKRINMAPYFDTVGRRFFNFLRSPEI